MKPKLLFFDTETTGVPKNYKASYTEVDNWPRVLSLAWMLTDTVGNVLNRQYHLIKPDGWEVPKEPFWINNGYTQERSLAEGKPIAEIIEMFQKDVQETNALVAHNIMFDHHIVWAEIIRLGGTPRSGLAKICTMQKSTNVCKIPHTNGRGYKWPKLEETYRHLFGCDFANAHDALADVQACMECFWQLVELGVIDLSITEKTEMV